MKTIVSHYLEFVAGASDKFYRIVVSEDGGQFATTATWGRRGSDGQSQVKYSGPDRGSALSFCEKGYNEKLGKGYNDALDPAESSQ